MNFKSAAFMILCLSLAGPAPLRAEKAGNVTSLNVSSQQANEQAERRKKRRAYFLQINDLREKHRQLLKEGKKEHAKLTLKEIKDLQKKYREEQKTFREKAFARKELAYTEERKPKPDPSEHGVKADISGKAGRSAEVPEKAAAKVAADSSLKEES